LPKNSIGQIELQKSGDFTENLFLNYWVCGYCSDLIHLEYDFVVFFQKQCCSAKKFLTCIVAIRFTKAGNLKKQIPVLRTLVASDMLAQLLKATEYSKYRWTSSFSKIY
jgi:hypothetical protein